jgi:hypothetical protein
MTRRAILFTFTILLSLNGLAHAQRSPERRERAISSQAPLQADLLATLDAAKLSIGTAIYAKARLDWNDPACHLRAGSVVLGHITELEQQTKQIKGSSLTISFDHADCEGRITPFSFVLFALVAKPQVDEGSPLIDSSSHFGTASTNPHISGGMGGSGSPPPSLPILTTKDDMSIRGQVPNDNTPGVIQAGQVVGIKKLTLSVGTGLDGASVLSSLKDNIRLEGATQLVLMPRRSITPLPAPPLSASADKPIPNAAPPTDPTPIAPPPPPPPPPPPEIDETSVCTAPCSLVPDPTGAAPAHASRSVSTTAFGYIPHNNREYEAFDFESTLIYLDAQNLLFTYDPHKLRQRLPSGFRSESTRTVRAVLLDPSTLKVKKILDWQIHGEGQYVWSAGPGQVLVHLGHNLRLLGPNLTVLREILLPGQLVYVSASPSGKHIAVGTLHERHTHALHDLLVEAVKNEPEEDTDVQLLDSSLQVELATLQSSLLPPPVLSDAGEIRLNAAGQNRWLIREFRWDHTIHTVATLTSACRPDIATPLPGAVFLIGCSQSPAQNWYRMIRLDGHPLLKGRGSSQEIEQSSSSSNQDAFAVRVVRANVTKSRGDFFHKEDLKEQEVSVYRASDGKRLFFTINSGVSLTQQSFALSPNGAQLAILSNLTISLYPIVTPPQ